MNKKLYSIIVRIILISCAFILAITALCYGITGSDLEYETKRERYFLSYKLENGINERVHKTLLNAQISSISSFLHDAHLFDAIEYGSDWKWQEEGIRVFDVIKCEWSDIYVYPIWEQDFLVELTIKDQYSLKEKDSLLIVQGQSRSFPYYAGLGGTQNLNGLKNYDRSDPIILFIFESESDGNRGIHEEHHYFQNYRLFAWYTKSDRIVESRDCVGLEQEVKFDQNETKQIEAMKEKLKKTDQLKIKVLDIEKATALRTDKEMVDILKVIMEDKDGSYYTYEEYLKELEKREIKAPIQEGTVTQWQKNIEDAFSKYGYDLKGLQWKYYGKPLKSDPEDGSRVIERYTSDYVYIFNPKYNMPYRIEFLVQMNGDKVVDLRFIEYIPYSQRPFIAEAEKIVSKSELDKRFEQYLIDKGAKKVSDDLFIRSEDFGYAYAGDLYSKKRKEEWASLGWSDAPDIYWSTISNNMQNAYYEGKVASLSDYEIRLAEFASEKSNISYIAGDWKYRDNEDDFTYGEKKYTLPDGNSFYIAFFGYKNYYMFLLVRPAKFNKDGKLDHFFYPPNTTLEQIKVDMDDYFKKAS